MDTDILLIGSTIYNSFFSSALKNLFEYINYKKTECKVAGIVSLAVNNIVFIDVQILITQLYHISE
jgi:NAD(P)H-dependent FMN reductase